VLDQTSDINEAPNAIEKPGFDEAIRFLTTAFPEFRIRGRGGAAGGEDEWVHVGTDETYLALSRAGASPPGRAAYRDPALNHLGFVVDDADALGSPTGAPPTGGEAERSPRFDARRLLADVLGSLGDAAGRAQILAQLAGETEEPGEQAQLLMAAAGSRLAAGDLDEALAAAWQAVALRPDDASARPDSPSPAKTASAIALIAARRT
jgi:hypothetical protein